MSENYLAYLLRLQRRSAVPNWYATLENAHTGELLTFRSEQELLVYLLGLLRPLPNPTNYDENQQGDPTAE